jgi:hypothetical protein
MSTVQVWEGDLFAGTLPPICALTGEPTSSFSEVRYRTTPRWVILLIFLGVVPFVVGWLLTRRVVGGVLPVSARVRKRLARQQLILYGICIGIAVLFVLASLLLAKVSTDVAAWLVPMGALITLLVVLVSLLWYAAMNVHGYVGEPGPWGRWVRLSNVSPTFVAAVGQMYAQRSAQLRGMGYPAFPPPMAGTPPPWAAAPPGIAPPPPPLVGGIPQRG